MGAAWEIDRELRVLVVCIGVGVADLPWPCVDAAITVVEAGERGAIVAEARLQRQGSARNGVGSRLKGSEARIGRPQCSQMPGVDRSTDGGSRGLSAIIDADAASEALIHIYTLEWNPVELLYSTHLQVNAPKRQGAAQGKDEVCAVDLRAVGVVKLHLRQVDPPAHSQWFGKR